MVFDSIAASISIFRGHIILMNERERLNAVRRYDILDTPPDGAYDHVTSLAARLFQVPISIISIVDSDRIWFKSHHGIHANEVDRELGLCASAILQNGPYVIEDAQNDVRSLANPLVAGSLGLRFYAGVPLTTTDGFNLGTLCVIDQKPRILEEGEIKNLEDLAALVVDQLELRLAAINSTAELLQAKAAVEKAHHAKGEFLSTLTHELRTPLNSILGFAQLLNMSTPPLAPNQQKDVNRIIRAGWHLSNMISDTHDLELIESGHLSIFLESVAIFDVLHECETMMRPQAQMAGIHLSVSRVDSQWFIRADKTRLRQVFINLLSNAIKYNRSGGKVMVDCERSDPALVRINIKDTGIGLPAAKKDKLFEAYNRLGQETGSKEGTGIGLAVTKKLVEMMGGSIGVESTEGDGSEFWVEFEEVETHQL